MNFHQQELHLLHINVKITVYVYKDMKDVAPAEVRNEPVTCSKLDGCK